MSWLMAFRFEKICNDDYFFSAISGFNVPNRYFIEGLYVISFYQSLSCFCQVVGLVPESYDLINKYIPAQKTLKPTP